jgi:hypothetical protein
MMTYINHTLSFIIGAILILGIEEINGRDRAISCILGMIIGIIILLIKEKSND